MNIPREGSKIIHSIEDITLLAVGIYSERTIKLWVWKPHIIISTWRPVNNSSWNYIDTKYIFATKCKNRKGLPMKSEFDIDLNSQSK